MQAIHNIFMILINTDLLFQRAKIQDKCKQFTTAFPWFEFVEGLFQRAKIQDKCKQFTTASDFQANGIVLFQRAKIQDKCKQFTTVEFLCQFFECCFKEQRYKINASNSQPWQG